MNRQQKRNLYWQMKSHNSRQSKVKSYVDYGKQVNKNVVEGNVIYTEVAFNALGLAMHRLYGFGMKRTRDVWTLADELVAQYGQGLISAEEIKRQAEEEIGISCNFK